MCSNSDYITNRQQLNSLSAFVDASQIYSNDETVLENLRSKKDGEMKLTTNNLLPVALAFGMDGCLTIGGCSLIGDPRGDKTIDLHSMYTSWVREHNRIAKALKGMNPSWDDEKIFQNARKIIIGLLQHITYNEYVPLLATISPYSRYDDKVDPSITNNFATAAFKFHLPLIPDSFAQLDSNFEVSAMPVLLQEAFFNRQIINDTGIEPTLRGLVVNMLNGIDNHFAFSTGSDGYFTIQRGRDHGLPSYNKFREACGLPIAKNWTELESLMLKNPAKRFKSLYESPDEIDLFVGGIAEKRKGNFLIGHLFSCLIGRQFTALRDGDRFYYENPGVFTEAQLEEIKKVTLAGILCNNVQGLVSVQPNVFHSPENTNLRKSCGSIPKLDMQPWSEGANYISNEAVLGRPMQGLIVMLVSVIVSQLL